MGPKREPTTNILPDEHNTTPTLKDLAPYAWANAPLSPHQKSLLLQ